jgi:hypothetical protein
VRVRRPLERGRDLVGAARHGLAVRDQNPLDRNVEPAPEGRDVVLPVPALLGLVVARPPDPKVAVDRDEDVPDRDRLV